MKIGFVILRSDIGGGPRHLCDLLVGLKKQDPSIQIHTASPQDPPYASQFQTCSDSFFPLDHRQFSFLKLIQLFLYFRRMNVDLIHSHGRGAGIYSGFLSIMGFKVIHTFHGLNPLKGFKEKLKSSVERILWCKVSQFVSVSKSEAQTAFTKYGIRNLQIIPNGIDLNSLEVTKNKEIRFKRLSAQGITHIQLGTISRLDPHKNNNTLIQKFKTLPSTYSLNIAGDGEEFESLQSLILQLKLDTRVKLVGAISNPYEFLNSIDVFVSASLSEGLPYSVIEAKAVGLPCVLSNVQGHNEIQDSFFFELNAQTESDDFRKAVTQASQNLNPVLTSQFDLKTMIENILKSYRTLLRS